MGIKQNFVMERAMRCLRLVVASGLMVLALPAAADDLGNADIIALVEAGVDDQIILSRIDSFPCVYDVSTSAIISLSRAGVPNRIISAMLQRCDENEQVQVPDEGPLLLDVPTEPGIYFRLSAQNAQQWVALDPSTGTSQWRGNGSLLFPFKLQLSVPVNQPRYSLPFGNLEFYLRLSTEPSDRRDVFTGNTPPPGLQQFGLARLTTANGFRRVLMRSSNNNSAAIIIDEDYYVSTSVQFIENGLYKINVNESLDRGFYGFVVKLNNGFIYRIFEFEVG